MLAFNDDVAPGSDLGFKHCVLSEAPHQNAGAAVDEALNEAFVQRGGYSVLYLTRDALPMGGVVKPARSVCDEAPCSNLREAIGKCRDVALDRVDQGDLAGDPIRRDFSASRDEGEDRRGELGMRCGRGFPIIRDLAGFPQALHVGSDLGVAANALLAAQDLERDLILPRRGARQPRLLGGEIERGDEVVDRGEVELGIAPLQGRDRFEAVFLQRLDQLFVEGRAAARRRKGAVAHVPPGAAGDLSELGARQPAMAPAVEFTVGGEGDQIDVEIESHADRVGRDDIVHLAALVELDLRVARLGRERAEHDGRAAPLALDPLGDGVDLFRREGDDGAARRQPHDLFRPGMAELRQPRTRNDRRAGHEAPNDRSERLGADQQRLALAAPAQQAIGEDVAAVEIGGKLRLVDRQKLDVEIARHGLHRRDPIVRRGRLDLLLARDERDPVRPDLLDDAPIDLAREQPQRQADQAAPEGEHPFDRVMRLAGVGRPEQRGDAVAPRLAAPTGRRLWEGPADERRLRRKPVLPLQMFAHSRPRYAHNRPVSARLTNWRHTAKSPDLLALMAASRHRSAA